MQLRKAILFCCLAGFASVGFTAEKTTYGRYEKVKLMDLNTIVPAKLDTGALTASLSATDIELFKKDGEEWVRFTPQIKGKKLQPMEYPVVKVAKIKRRAADITDVDTDTDTDEENDDKAEVELYTYRPEIEMKVCMGNTLGTINVNLTDRSAFSYPLLIGTRALRQFKAVVDPSLKYRSKANCTVNNGSKAE